MACLRKKSRLFWNGTRIKKYESRMIVSSLAEVIISPSPVKL